MNGLERVILGKRTAILLVDVQNDYCHPHGALAAAGNDVSGVGAMMPSVHALLAGARENQIPIIYIQTFHEEATDSEVWRTRSSGRSAEVCRIGSWGADFYEVKPQPEEIIINKHRYSAFIHTRLDSVLRSLKIETLIIGGVSTNVCVESTARDAFMLDYHVVLASDACASYSRKAHEMTLENIAGYFGVVSDTGSIVSLWQRELETPLRL